MKNTIRRLLCLLLALCMCAGLALGAAADEEPSVSYGQIEIREDSISAHYGDVIRLNHTVSPESYSGHVIWSSSDKSVATVKDGVVTVADRGEGVRTVVITATLDDNGEDSSSDSCTITVDENKITGFAVSSPDCTISGGGEISLTGRTSFTLVGTTMYESGSDDDKTGAKWGEISNLFVVKREDDSGKFVTVGEGSATIEVICPYDGSRTQTVTVTVADAPLESLSISGTGVSGGKAALTVGAALALSAAKVPANTFNNDAVTWTSSNTDVATVDANGNVKAVKYGDAKITAACGGKSATVAVTVQAPSKDVSASVTRGKELTFTDIGKELSAIFIATYGKSPSGVKLTSLGSSSIGTVYDANGANISTSKSYTPSEFGKFYFVPAAIGTSTLKYTLTDGTNTISGGTITVKVEGAKTKDITVKLSADTSSYAFSSSATVDKTAATETIKKAISDASGKTYGYIAFDTGSISSGSKKVGTLWPSSAKDKDLQDYGSYTYGSANSQQSQVSKLYFEAKREGEYSIGYTAYDASGSELCSGDLIIIVGAANDAAVTVTLDGIGRYTFSEKTKKDKISAASAIDEVIKDETGKTYGYIKFGSVVSGSDVGELYSDSGKTAIKTTAQYKRSASSGYVVSDLYFVPERSGTYVRSFTAYSSGGSELLLGTLKIVVPGDGEGEMDIYFNTTAGSSLSMSENVFESWYRQQKGTNYKLAYVTFDAGGRGFGSFKSGSSSFTPGNEVKYYTRGFTGSTGSSPKYLDKVSFTAPDYTGYVSVDFTCYGGTSASASGARASGTFFIFVTKGSVKPLSYDVKYGSALKLNEGDFTSVYKNAMSLSSGASTRYCVELLEIPAKGTLYYNYTSASRPGTKLTGSNFDDYEFYVSASSAYDSIGDLTYVPANSSSGTVSVRYLAKSASGGSLYVGTVSFNYGRQPGLSVSCGPDGYVFKDSDFYSGADADPVAYVSFSQPDFGELMLGYASGRGIPLDSSVRLYTSKSANGSYPLSSLAYIPKAGFSGNVEINYSAVTESGKVQNGVMTVSVTGRKGSAHFRDVQSTGSGAWASDAIDFAYKWGLVNGTGEDTFSPDATMTRAMLVTILYRSAGAPKVSSSCPFTDVAPGAYYYEPVLWAAENGIVTGTSATTFSPDRDVNREQVAAFLHRYARYNGENVEVTGSLNGYSDKNFVSAYAIEPMSWAVQRGYITSASGEELLLSPGGSATRAQVAVMLHRFLTY